MTPPLLRLVGLTVEAPWGRVVKDLDLRVDSGEILGLVGESGCGKTITARALLGLLPSGWRSLGHAEFMGQDLLATPQRFRGSGVGMLFQEPSSVFNPFLSVGAQIAEGLPPGSDKDSQILRLLDEVQIPDPERVARAYPHQLSGGLKQRAALASALAGNPRLLIADEPTTALDPTVGAKILKGMEQLAQKRGMGVILITHDLSAARSLCHGVAVMYAGSLVEEGPMDSVFLRPRHPYTRALTECVVKRHQSPKPIPGQPPTKGDNFRGCPFSPRCPKVGQGCQDEEPSLTRENDRAFRCHYPVEAT